MQVSLMKIVMMITSSAAEEDKLAYYEKVALPPPPPNDILYIPTKLPIRIARQYHNPPHKQQ